MDDLLIPLIFSSPLYIPAIAVAVAALITAKERKHPAVFTKNDEFPQMKKSVLGFKLAATISQCILFALCVVDLFFFTSHNDGGLMGQIIIFISFIPVAATSLLALRIYNYLFLTETNLKAAIILAFPFSTLVFIVLLGAIFFNDVGILPLLILAPYTLIFIIMQVILCSKRKKFPDPLTLKLRILSKAR